ncbi:hypothetical protein KJ878_03195, partial [Patescibacteria group bacterium]|nr:hypothetical protein [Patescibacteria group bacterium]
SNKEGSESERVFCLAPKDDKVTIFTLNLTRCNPYCNKLDNLTDSNEIGSDIKKKKGDTVEKKREESVDEKEELERKKKKRMMKAETPGIKFVIYL